MLKASQTGWHSLDSNPSLADSKVGALPNVLCCSLASGACTLSPSTPGSEGLNVRDSSPGQGPEPRPWTLTLAPVCQPASRNAHAHVPGLSLGSAASVSLGNRSTADKFSASCPSWAEPLRSVTTPGAHSPNPKTVRRGGGCGRGEGRVASGRKKREGALLSPQTVLVYATPSLPTSVRLPWFTSFCLACPPSATPEWPPPSQAHGKEGLPSPELCFHGQHGPMGRAPQGCPLRPLLHLMGSAPCPRSRNTTNPCQAKPKTQCPNSFQGWSILRLHQRFFRLLRP